MNNALPIVFGTSPSGVVCDDRSAAYAVINNPDGDVAVVSANVRGRQEYWLPGGGMFENESPEETIVREIREELGREARLRRQIGRAVQFFYAGDEQRWYKMKVIFFFAELLGNANGHEEFELHWVDPNLRKSDFFHECHVWAARH